MRFAQNIILTAICGLFVSCVKWGSMENNRLMQQVRVFAEVQPDSALMLLNRINTALLSDTERAEYTLLRVQTRDNAEYDLTTDIEIFKAREFFLKEKKWEKAALACFFAGKVVDERDDVALETAFYQEALDLAIKTNHELLQGKILYAMGFTNFDRHWYTDAIAQYQQALKIFQTATDQYQQEIYSWVAVGNSFIVEQKADSAQRYFETALYRAQMRNDTALQVMVYNNMLEAYRELGMTDAAKFCGWQALNLVTADRERADVYINLAQVFQDENCFDSARYYMQKTLPLIAKLNDIYDLINMYHVCYQIEKNTGNAVKALEYFEQYTLYRNELTDWNKKQKLLEFQHKYRNAEKENEYHRAKSRLLGLASALGFMAVFLSMAVFRMKKKNILQKAEAEQKSETLQNMFRERNSEIQTAFLEKLQIIKDISLVNLQKTTPASFHTEVNAIMSAFTIQKFVEITEELYPSFNAKLQNSFPNANLTEQETTLCCLTLCGFSNKELALFINQSKDTQSVEKMKNRIRKKLGMDAYDRNIKDFLLAQTGYSENKTGQATSDRAHDEAI